MKTQRLGFIDLDEVELGRDLAKVVDLPTVSPYQEFVCGRPSRSIMLWAPGGIAGDGVISRYRDAATPGLTELGRQLPYLASLLSGGLLGSSMRFARLAILSDSVLVPHQDYVEMQDRPLEHRPACRLHVPLQTNDGCLFLADSTVFRMAVGEVWHLDVREVHGAAAFSEEIRVHLVVDLAASASGSPAASGPEVQDRIPPERIVELPRLEAEERNDLLALARLVDRDNVHDVLAILAKKQYRRDGGSNFFWDVVSDIAARATDAATRRCLEELREHFLLVRSE